MIMPCMNSTSACESGGRAAFVEGGSVLLGLPGAPGCTTTGFDESFCCADTVGDKTPAELSATRHRNDGLIFTTGLQDRPGPSAIAILATSRLLRSLRARTHAVSGRLAGPAGVPLGVGDFIVGDTAHDFLSTINHATVVGAIAKREPDVLGPLVGFLVPLGTVLRRRNRGPGAGNQALVDGDSGLRLAVAATREQEDLTMSEIDDGDRVRLSIWRKFLWWSDLQRASAANLHDVC